MKDKNAPMTHGEFQMLHALLLKMRSENENNYNELRDDIREIKGDIRHVKVDVSTIASELEIEIGKNKKTA